MNWTAAEKKIIARLKTPLAVQEYLDAIPYSPDPFYRSPRRVIADQTAHCFDGAVFAAAALEQIGFRPLILELKAEHDDDHLLALFKVNRHWGAVAKSNFVGLRYREPIHRCLRELAMTFFNDFYNVAAEKSLRSYSAPLDLRPFRRPDWRFADPAMDQIADRLDRSRHYLLLTLAMVRRLARVDERSLKAGLQGSDPRGLFKP